MRRRRERGICLMFISRVDLIEHQSGSGIRGRGNPRCPIWQRGDDDGRWSSESGVTMMIAGQVNLG